jgi:2-dehydropantoate 2-reductase
MRIAVFGAGAVGSHLAVRLGFAGHEVSVVARGAQLTAIAANGLTLEAGAERLIHRPNVSADPRDLGQQQLVLVTLKAYAQPGAADAIAALLGPDTPVVFVQNGIPWWLPLSPPPPRGNGWPDLGFLDPGGRLERAVGRGRVLGGVVTSANAIVSPGVVRADPPRPPRLVIGEIDGKPSERVATWRDILSRAGIESPPVPHIVGEIWRKLVLNLSASSLALLTERHSSVVREDAAIGALSRQMIGEIVAVARSCGIDLAAMAADPGTILAQAPDRQPSLLQDRQAGRPLEYDSLFRAPQSLARARGVATPVLDVVTALVGALAAARH